MDQIKNLIILLLLIFGIIMTILYWYEIESKERFYRIKDTMIKQKEIALNIREKKVLEKEACMAEITRLKSMRESVMNAINVV